MSQLQLPSFRHDQESSSTTLPPKSTQPVGKDDSVKCDGSSDKLEPAPFILNEALPVVLAKLVKRILKGEYVDMCELLKDNIEAERKRTVSESRASCDPLLKAPQLREIPDMLSWLQCFSLFAGIVISKHPEKAKELLAYQALMIYEACTIGGRGWAQYDACFRQQIQSLSSANFGTLNQSLYSTTFLAMRGRGQFCTGCMGADHTYEECALHPKKNHTYVYAISANGES